MEKQKAAPIDDHDIKPKKIRKIETRATLTQNKVFGQIQSQYESTPRIVNSTQAIDDPATENGLDRLLGIWNHAKENHFVSLSDNQVYLSVFDGLVPIYAVQKLQITVFIFSDSLFSFSFFNLQEELRELNEKLAEGNMVIQQLESDLDKIEKKNSEMAKYIEEEVAIQNEIIEK